jgi:hypothetical protein
MESDFSHGRKGFRIQINDLGLIYIQYFMVCFIIDVIPYPKTFSTKFSTNPVWVLNLDDQGDDQGTKFSRPGY